jgi:hypothetical protein
MVSFESKEEIWAHFGNEGEGEGEGERENQFKGVYLGGK